MKTFNFTIQLEDDLADLLIANNCNSFVVVDNDRAAPEIIMGDYVFLKQIPIDEIKDLGNDNYMVYFENGPKEFYRGIRDNRMLWFRDFVTFEAKSPPSRKIESMYRIVAVNRPPKAGIMTLDTRNPVV
jgi:hypothetical protein